MKDCFWSLYNTVDDTRVDGLKTLQVKTLMRTFARGTLDEWLVWEENTPDWRRASEVVDHFLGSASAAVAEATATAEPTSAGTATHKFPPEATGTKTEKVLSDATSGSIRGPNYPDERKSPRFLVAFKIFINAQGRVITNTTENVSVGGMRLRHALPKDITGSFDVTVFLGNEELSMRCRVVKNASEKEAKRLLIEHCNRLDLLRTWLTQATDGDSNA